MVTALREVPDSAWSAAIDADEKVRDDAGVIDATGVLNLATSPPGMCGDQKGMPASRWHRTDTDARIHRPRRAWEPKRLRLRIASVAGRIAVHARRTRLRLSTDAAWSALIVNALTRLAALTDPA